MSGMPPPGEVRIGSFGDHLTSCRGDRFTLNSGPDRQGTGATFGPEHLQCRTAS
jgi:hypothetical protein